MWNILFLDHLIIFQALRFPRADRNSLGSETNEPFRNGIMRKEPSETCRCLSKGIQHATHRMVSGWLLEMIKDTCSFGIVPTSRWSASSRDTAEFWLSRLTTKPSRRWAKTNFSSFG